MPPAFVVSASEWSMLTSFINRNFKSQFSVNLALEEKMKKAFEKMADLGRLDVLNMFRKEKNFIAPSTTIPHAARLSDVSSMLHKKLLSLLSCVRWVLSPMFFNKIWCWLLIFPPEDVFQALSRRVNSFLHPFFWLFVNEPREATIWGLSIYFFASLMGNWENFHLSSTFCFPAPSWDQLPASPFFLRGLAFHATPGL